MAVRFYLDVHVPRAIALGLRLRGVDVLTAQDDGAERLADAEREIEAIWARCEVWELTRGVCELARQVAPTKGLRTLDALHLATFLLARRKIEGIVLLTADERLRDAAGSA